MVHVVEYGENIGTLRNLFRNVDLALIFAKKILEYSEEDYEIIGSNEWYCPAKKEYIKIEDTELLLN